MNLLMVAPLCDSRGKIRYFIGAQVDVSGMVKQCTDLESLQRLVVEQQSRQKGSAAGGTGGEKKDEFQQLSEMLNTGELETVRRWGGRMHREVQDDEDESGINSGLHKPRLLLKDPSPDVNTTLPLNGRGNGRLSGVYQHVSDPKVHGGCVMEGMESHVSPVSPRPTSSLASCSVRFAFASCTGYPAISLHEQDWWLGPRSR